MMEHSSIVKGQYVLISAGGSRVTSFVDTLLDAQASTPAGCADRLAPVTVGLALAAWLAGQGDLAVRCSDAIEGEQRMTMVRSDWFLPGYWLLAPLLNLLNLLRIFVTRPAGTEDLVRLTTIWAD